MSKIRLDQYLCQNGLVQSRERAKALIMSGIVFVDEQKADKSRGDDRARRQSRSARA